MVCSPPPIKIPGYAYGTTDVCLVVRYYNDFVQNSELSCNILEKISIFNAIFRFVFSDICLG